MARRAPKIDGAGLFDKTEPNSATADRQASETVRQSDSIPVYQHDSTPVHQPNSTAADQQDSKPVKATYYLSPSVAEALDAAWVTLRKRKVSKSAIVEAALLAALGDAEFLAGLE